MIITHPFLFNAIVVFFIAFTSGWLVFVINSKITMNFKRKIAALEKEKEQTQVQMRALEEQLEKHFTYPLNNTPVISLASSAKTNNKTS